MPALISVNEGKCPILHNDYPPPPLFLFKTYTATHASSPGVGKTRPGELIEEDAADAWKVPLGVLPFGDLLLLRGHVVVRNSCLQVGGQPLDECCWLALGYAQLHIAQRQSMQGLQTITLA